MKKKILTLIILVVITFYPFLILINRLRSSYCDLMIGPTVENCYKNLGGIPGFAYNSPTVFYFVCLVLYILLIFALAMFFSKFNRNKK